MAAFDFNGAAPASRSKDTLRTRNGDTQLSDESDKRAIDRDRVLRSAKVQFNNSVFDCIVLDQSPTGLRVSTPVPIPFPERVVVELRSGERWSAIRRWQQGVETGLEREAFLGLNDDAMRHARDIGDRIRRTGVLDVLLSVATDGCFGSAELKAATLTASDSMKDLLERFDKLAGLR